MEYLNGERGYLSVLKSIFEASGEKNDKMDRTGVGTRSLFTPPMITYDLCDNRVPLLTTKRILTKSIIEELLWFVSGSTNVNDLNNSIWDAWADENGDLGPVYGYSWRSLPNLVKLGEDEEKTDWRSENNHPIDQLLNLQQQLRNNRNSRRHILMNWNPIFVNQCALPPCHLMAQFYVSNDDELSCTMYQRSGDMFLGVPFNIASYAILTHMLAMTTGYKVGKFNHIIGDAHIYHNHFPMVEEQLSRSLLPCTPTLTIKKRDCITEFEYGDFEISDYSYHPWIKAPIAV